MVTIFEPDGSVRATLAATVTIAFNMAASVGEWVVIRGNTRLIGEVMGEVLGEVMGEAFPGSRAGRPPANLWTQILSSAPIR